MHLCTKMHNELPYPSSIICCHSVQFSPVTFHSLRSHELQHARPSCPSPTLRVHPNPCPSSWWCHPTISSSVVPSSSCPQSFLASGSFLMSWLFESGGQSSAASASVLPVNIQGSFPLELTGLILQSKGLLRDFSSTTVQKHPFFGTQPPYGPTLTFVHDYWKNHILTVRTFVSKVMSLLFNMLLRFVIAFLPRSKHSIITFETFW